MKAKASTILSEHRRVSAGRHILALVIFTAILIGTVVTIVFTSRRGAPVGVFACLYVLMALNIAQLGLCIADYVLKQFCGIYIKWLVLANYLTGAAWLLIVILEVLIASLQMGVMRTDLAIIAGVQLITAVLAYVLWPALDRKAIDSMIRPSVRGDGVAKSRNAFKYVILYALLCAFIVLVQVFGLFVYKLPPRLYDIFADTRAVMYEESEDGKSYIVKGIYQGTATSVVIPAQYNGKPVTGIAGGALADDDVIERYKVTEITFGSYETDEEGNLKLVSNIEYLEEGAISNDKITKLTIPDSVTEMEDGSISGSSLTELKYEARAGFRFSYLKCPALQEITMSGDKVGNLISLKGMGENTLIRVSKDIYNTYRRNNPEYLHSFRPILTAEEFCVDFYTDSDYYIESIFSQSGNAVNIGYRDLKNDSLAGVSPVVDTLAYIRNNHELDTDGVKEKSAFRGWYFDPAFARECEFTENGTQSFTDNTALYARWIPEYTGQINWGTYTPAGAVNRMVWTDEDVVAFPVVENRKGYSQGVRWTVGGTQDVVTDSRRISRDVTLNGEWLLDKPTVRIEHAAADADDNFVITGNSISFIYDETRKLLLTASYNHELENIYYDGEQFDFDYEWTQTGEAFSLVKRPLGLQNVLQGGTYALTVTAISPYGERSSRRAEVTVNISKKPLNLGSVALPDDTREYSSVIQKLPVTGSLPDNSNINITYEYSDGQTVTANGVINAGVYTVKAFFVKNNADEAANYETAEKQATLTIERKMLTIGEDEGWQGEGVGWDDNSVVYDGQPHRYRLIFGGAFTNDDVDLIYSDEIKTAVGEYTARVTGVNNQNYSLDGIAGSLSHAWSITQRTVSVKEWQVDGRAYTGNGAVSIVYDGRLHEITAVMEGYVGDDVVEFVYRTGESFTRSATNVYAGYRAQVAGVTNGNYKFDGLKDALDWAITQRPLTVTFTGNKLTYNGSEQGITATIDGFAPGDAEVFATAMATYKMLEYAGKSEQLLVNPPTVSDNRVQLYFTAREADGYTAAVSGLAEASAQSPLILSNYSLTAGEREFNIEPKQVTFGVGGPYTYNGSQQNLVIKVYGLESSDLQSVALGDFTTDGAISGNASGDTYNIMFAGRDAGSYEAVVTAFANSNYVMEEYSASIVISPKTVTVSGWTLTDKATGVESVITAGRALTYNYNGYSLRANLAGVVAGDSLDAVTADGEESQVASDYVTTASLPAGTKNYVLGGTNNISWSISPYILNVTWSCGGTAISDNRTFIYRGSDYRVDPVYTLLGDDSINLSYGSGTRTAKDVGNYSIGLIGTGNANYELAANSAISWTIAPKTVNVSWEDTAPVTYASQYRGPTAVLDGLIESETDSLYIRYTSRESELAGQGEVSGIKGRYAITGMILADTYNLRVTAICDSHGTTNNNYTVVCATCPFIITKKQITLTGVWNYSNGSSTSAYSDSVTYNRNDYTLTTDIEDGVVLKDDVRLLYSGNTARNAGNYKASVIGLGGTNGSNYVISSSSVTSREWKISPKVVSYSWSDGNSFTYRGTPYTYSATLASGAICSGDSASLTFSGNTATDVGSYETVVTGINNTNYALDAQSVARHSWSISPYTVTGLMWSADSLVYNGAAQYPTARFTACGQTVNITSYTGDINVRNVGSYNVIPASTGNGNFVLSTELGKGHSFGITAKKLTFSWNTSNITYDGVTRTAQATAVGVCAGDTVNLTYDKTDRSYRNATSYSFAVTALDNANYSIDETSAKVAVTVQRRQAILEWTGGSTAVYDGNAHIPTARVTNTCAGDVTVTVTNYERNDTNGNGTDVGRLTVSAISLSNENYSILSGSNQFTITVNPQPVRITWPNTSYTYNGTQQSITPSVVGVNDGKAVQFTLSGNTFTSAGSHSVRITALSDGNYTLTGATGQANYTVTVAQASVSLQWSGASSVIYDGNYHAATASVNGGLGSDTFDIRYSYSGTSNGTNAGTRTATVTGLGNSNYALPASGLSYTVTINPQVVTVEWNCNPSAVYDGSWHNITPTVRGTQGDTTYWLKATLTGDTSYRDVGSYTARVTAVSDSNYTVTGCANSSFTVTVTARSVTVAWSGIPAEGAAADGNVINVTAKFDGLDYGDNVTAIYTITCDGRTVDYVRDAGEYVIRVTFGGSDAGNYKVNGDTEIRFTLANRTQTTD